ncbi:MAG: DUF1778 domain-containing protein [Candidatus Omnitrophica bacterium]|nr:DUF1778 domain-containing protein [Candidatus Omnitrophota bacterium]
MREKGKTLYLQIRVSPKQKRLIRQASQQENTSISEWVLRKVLPDQASFFQSLVKELARTSQNQSYVWARMNDFLVSLSKEEFSIALENPVNAKLSAYTANYLAAMVEYAAAQKELPPPLWVNEIEPLTKAYFGSPLQSLRLHLLLSSPVVFRRRNIFIDATIGDRV